MLYKFKSKASGNLIMMEADGRRLLQIIGKTELHRGVLLPQDMPAAIAALQHALIQEDAARTVSGTKQPTDEATLAWTQPISLRQRSLPFMQMLQRCQNAQKEITWGV
jgi:hypothetical protein